MNHASWSITRVRVIFCAITAIVLIVIPLGFSREVLRPEMMVVERCGGSRYFAYWLLIGNSIARLFVSAASSFLVISVVVGALWMLPRKLAGAVETILSAIRYTPAISWLPMTIALVGISNFSSQVVFVLAGASPVVLFHLLHGLRSCSPHLITVARLSGATSSSILKLRLAAAAPEVFHALRLNIGVAFVLTVVYGMLFPSIQGLERLVETLEVLRYPLSDFLLFAAVLLSLGVLLDQCCGLGQEILVIARTRRARASAAWLRDSASQTN